MTVNNENARPGETGRAREHHSEKAVDDLGNDSAPELVVSTPSFDDVRALDSAGYELVLLGVHTKAPVETNWSTAEADNARVIATAEARGANIGVRLCGTDLVLDVDHRNGGEHSLERLVEDLRLDLSKCPVTNTGGGGEHYYFRRPAGTDLRTKLDEYPGIDFKSTGQVVAPGSVHPSGRFYTSNFFAYGPDVTPTAPRALLDALARPRKAAASAERGGELTRSMLAANLAMLEPDDFAQHDDWLALMMACHHATNGEGKDEFIEWSTQGAGYSDHGDAIAYRWDSLSVEDGGVTVQYLYRQLHDRGLTPVDRPEPEDDFTAVQSLPADRRVVLRHMCLAEGKKNKYEANFPNCLKVLRLISDELGLAFDEFSQTAWLTARQLPWTVDIGRRINDDVMRRIRQYLVEATGMNWGKDDVTEAVLTLVHENPYHPVRNYLDSLRWDGVQRLDTWLARYAGAPDSAYCRGIGAKILLAAVRRARRPGCKFDNVIVLEGSQGSGKSSLVKALVPNEEWFSDAPIGNTESKDAPLSLQGKWIIELGEMSVLSKSGVESLKAFVSCSVDHVRRPYARMHEEFRRQCVFIGTTNQDSYLKDQTGNRRFWPIRVGTIDLNALAADRDQLWAEAAEREAAGESVLLPAELWDLAATEQEERVADDPWVDVLRTYLDGTAGNGPADRIDRVHSTTLLTVALGIRTSDQVPAHAHRLRVVMTKYLGWVHKHNVRAGEDAKQGRGYQRA